VSGQYGVRDAACPLSTKGGGGGEAVEVVGDGDKSRVPDRERLDAPRAARDKRVHLDQRLAGETEHFRLRDVRPERLVVDVADLLEAVGEEEEVVVSDLHVLPVLRAV